ncbi:unnamed protein product [Mytilus edulis]|uniref:Uncharacterized protein n=1 Tax=Mytilus edulis TaxID=6550 RepID=A0A8S3SC62_MYTED|nr:unnamed protein product [Mytilus edulis]
MSSYQEVNCDMFIPDLGDVAVKRLSADLYIFNPSRVIYATAAFATRRPRSWPWKQDRKAATFDKLQIPLPIQHPASIAISIYNREHDQNPINYDDYYCQRIIRATKEVPYMGDPISNDFYEVELTDNTIENETPEKNIDNLSSPYLHIAQQERSFSDENMAASPISINEVDVVVHSSPMSAAPNETLTVGDVVVHSSPMSAAPNEKLTEVDVVVHSSPMSAAPNETLTEGDVVVNAQYKSDVAVKTSNEGDIVVNTPDKSDVVERVCFEDKERDTSCAIDIPDIPDADA